jgi:ABC-type nickel/cobalt efflux system permease component RcnA
LPESKEVWEEWAKKNINQENLQELPYCFFVAFLAYSFFLFVEKVLFSASSLIPMIRGEGHHHGHDHDHVHDSHEHHEHDHHPEHSSPDTSEDEDEEAFKNVVSSKGKFASFLGMRNRKELKNKI